MIWGTKKFTIDPIDGIDPITRSFYYIGLWPKETGYSNRSYFIYAVIIHILFSYICAVTMISALFQITDIVNSMNYIFIVFREQVYIVILSFWIYKRKNFVKVLKMLKEDLTLDSDDKKEQILISRGIIRARKLYFSFVISFPTAILFAFFEAVIRKDKSLVFEAVFPYDYTKSIWYYLPTMVYQCIAITVQCVFASGAYALPSSMLCILTGYFDALGYNLSQLGQECEDNIGYRKINAQKNIKKLAIKYYKLQR